MSIQDTTIRTYRKKAGLSQIDLAKLLNTTQTNISFIETKRQYPDIKEAEKIAEILHVTIGALWRDYELELILEKSK